MAIEGIEGQQHQSTHHIGAVDGEMTSNAAIVTTRVGGIMFGLFFMAFGTPFILVPFIVFGFEGISFDGETLYLFCFTIPFLGAGLLVFFIGLSSLKFGLFGEIEIGEQSHQQEFSLEQSSDQRYILHSLGADEDAKTTLQPSSTTELSAPEKQVEEGQPASPTSQHNGDVESNQPLSTMVGSTENDAIQNEEADSPHEASTTSTFW